MLMDYGMATLYGKDPKKLPEKSQYKFLGTEHYAPLASYAGKPQTRRDDLESWVYVVSEGKEEGRETSDDRHPAHGAPALGQVQHGGAALPQEETSRRRM